MIALLALAAATAQPSVIDAERAFAAMAQTKGQWTAFRATALPDATMFVPQPVKAQEWLKDRKDPPKAIRWQPIAAWMSCDGTLAVTTGNWQRDSGVGYFTTVWKKQADGGWKWVLDSGDAETSPRPASPKPKLIRASCKPVGFVPTEMRMFGWVQGGGSSKDETTDYGWAVRKDGSRSLVVHVWNGREREIVIDDQVAAEK